MNKYGVAPKHERQADGRTFASKKEKTRYLQLKLLQKAGKIKELVCQPRFALPVYDVHCGWYVADFSYYDRKTMNWVVEDVKGVKTPVYKIKKKLMRAVHGIEIKEV